MDLQIVVGSVVDRAGFPLEIHSVEGHTAEIHTILLVIQALQARHQVADTVVVTEAGMLSDTNLAAIDAAGLRFIVGSKQTKAPWDLAASFHHHTHTATNSTVTTRDRFKPANEPLDTIIVPVWDPDTDAPEPSGNTRPNAPAGMPPP
ncbi:hypothetical protein [Enteractinococcus helveticum]|uniref:Transposase IS4-like domain-containing protein n=1 Tax=Enteractinococcus helveticum TaxID=1837282 RepID=A0A1B7M219_9MICC|nr:hypothetical protein [Enteractinococcus helveticum]OAV62605.1 hypothetical protein A6F49_05415 [Enteractinococcus helveticum]